jgi:hypothetical protein
MLHRYGMVRGKQYNGTVKVRELAGFWTFKLKVLEKLLFVMFVRLGIIRCSSHFSMNEEYLMDLFASVSCFS